MFQLVSIIFIHFPCSNEFTKPPALLPSLNLIQATYGVKMAEKVRDLLLRLATARRGFEVLRPRLEPLVRQREHRAAASEAELQRKRRAEEEAKEREAQEAARSWEKLEDSKIFSKDLRDL